MTEEVKYTQSPGHSMTEEVKYTQSPGHSMTEEVKHIACTTTEHLARPPPTSNYLHGVEV